MFFSLAASFSNMYIILMISFSKVLVSVLYTCNVLFSRVCFSNTCNIFFSVVLVSVLHTCDVFSLGCKFQYMHCFYSRVIVSAIPTYIIVILFSKVLVAVIHTCDVFFSLGC